MNWQTLISSPWAVTVGGGIAVALIVAVSTKLLGNWKSRERKGGSLQEQASPVITQNFQPTINIPVNIHPPLTAMAEDMPGPLRTIPTEVQADAVRELWRRVVALKDAFWTIPKTGGVIGRRPDAKDSAEFVRRYDEAARFLNTESLSIPKVIAAETKALLDIAFEEALKACHYPDPFDGSGSAALGEKGWCDFVESRSNNLKNFTAGTDKLHETMRSFLDG